MQQELPEHKVGTCPHLPAAAKGCPQVPKSCLELPKAAQSCLQSRSTTACPQLLVGTTGSPELPACLGLSGFWGCPLAQSCPLAGHLREFYVSSMEP